MEGRIGGQDLGRKEGQQVWKKDDTKEHDEVGIEDNDPHVHRWPHAWTA